MPFGIDTKQIAQVVQDIADIKAKQEELLGIFPSQRISKIEAKLDVILDALNNHGTSNEP